MSIDIKGQILSNLKKAAEEAVQNSNISNSVILTAKLVQKNENNRK